MSTQKTLSAAQFKKAVKGFQQASNSRGKALYDREISFDICYDYFYRNRESLTQDIEKSCCVLWSYLASWGMLRGSSFLLQKNPAYLAKLIGHIESKCQDIYQIDIDNYTKANIKRMLTVYNQIYELLGGDKTHPSSTLITKIMLGVFGCIPAYDTYFCETFSELIPRVGFSSKIVNEETLGVLSNFYDEYSSEVDKLALECKVSNPFNTSSQTRNYTKAKIVDMFGFNYSLSKQLKI